MFSDANVILPIHSDLILEPHQNVILKLVILFKCSPSCFKKLGQLMLLRKSNISFLENILFQM